MHLSLLATGFCLHLPNGMSLSGGVLHTIYKFLCIDFSVSQPLQSIKNAIQAVRADLDLMSSYVVLLPKPIYRLHPASGKAGCFGIHLNGNPVWYLFVVFAEDSTRIHE
jgi:hypothetical protein